MSATGSIKSPGTGARGTGISTNMPTTRLGRTAMWLALAFIIGMALNGPLVGIVGRSSGAAVNEFSRTYLPYWGVGLFAVGFSAGVVGLVAILKDKERSLLTFLALLPMLFVALFVLGELLFPH